MATIYLYVIVPKGFFPVQDTGVILGISEAPQTRQLRRHVASCSRSSTKVILKDPAVESLSSFIGIDGTNTTSTAAASRSISSRSRSASIIASEVIRRLQPELAKVEGITLYMQPVQDLTVEARVSRTQYQYSLEDPDAKELSEWVPQAGRQARKPCRSCATWPATSRTTACRPGW